MMQVFETLPHGRQLTRVRLSCIFMVVDGLAAQQPRHQQPRHGIHYSDVIMGSIASQIISLTIVYSTVYSGADQRKHQSSASLAFVRGIHRRPVNSPHKGPVTRKMFPFDDVIMWQCHNNSGIFWYWGSQHMEAKTGDIFGSLFVNGNYCAVTQISLDPLCAKFFRWNTNICYILCHSSSSSSSLKRKCRHFD